MVQSHHKQNGISGRNATRWCVKSLGTRSWSKENKVRGEVWGGSLRLKGHLSDVKPWWADKVNKQLKGKWTANWRKSGGKVWADEISSTLQSYAQREGIKFKAEPILLITFCYSNGDTHKPLTLAVVLQLPAQTNYYREIWSPSKELHF